MFLLSLFFLFHFLIFFRSGFGGHLLLSVSTYSYIAYWGQKKVSKQIEERERERERETEQETKKTHSVEIIFLSHAFFLRWYQRAGIRVCRIWLRLSWGFGERKKILSSFSMRLAMNALPARPPALSSSLTLSLCLFLVLSLSLFPSLLPSNVLLRVLSFSRAFFGS